MQQRDDVISIARFRLELISKLAQGEAGANLWLNLPRTRPAPLMPPDFGWANLFRLERDAGVLPISLRAWYDVIGSVDLRGKHAVLSPGGGAVLTEPLGVAPFSQILREWDHSPPDVGVDGRPFAV